MTVNLPQDWVPLLIYLLTLAGLFANTRAQVQALREAINDIKRESEKKGDEVTDAHRRLSEKLDSVLLVQARSDEKLVQMSRDQSIKTYSNGNGHSTPPRRRRRTAKK